MNQNPKARQSLLRRLRRFLTGRNGNVAIISSLVMVPMVFLAGAGIDYTLSRHRQDQINGFADAAALMAVTPAMMGKTSTVAQTAALNMFTAQLHNLSNISYDASNINVTVTDTDSAVGVTRTVKVAYTGSSSNIFTSVLGMPSLPISGSSSASSSLAPNIDFYLLLDTSPSMGIAATTSDINTMVTNTSAQGGCAFACHETNPAGDNLGNPKNVTCTSGVKSFPTGGEDNYALARCLGVTLRIDLVNQAVQNLMTSAAATEVQNNVTYRAAIYTIDYNLNQLQSITADLSAAKTSAANIAALTVYDNSCLTSTNCNNDQDSYLDLTGLAGMYAKMPTPGNGTSAVGDTPQEVLMIVSDGVTDEVYNGGRGMFPIDSKTTWCTQIKNKGIRIAFLYLTYYPLPTNSFYNSNIAPFQPSIATWAQTCASPGLYFQVSTNGDVSSAMNTLFQQAIATARLTQ